MIYYPKPMHEQTAYSGLGYMQGSSPVAEQLCATVLSLPLHPYISIDDIDLVTGKIREFLGK